MLATPKETILTVDNIIGNVEYQQKITYMCERNKVIRNFTMFAQYADTIYGATKAQLEDASLGTVTTLTDKSGCKSFFITDLGGVDKYFIIPVIQMPEIPLSSREAIPVKIGNLVAVSLVDEEEFSVTGTLITFSDIAIQIKSPTYTAPTDLNESVAMESASSIDGFLQDITKFDTGIDSAITVYNELLGNNMYVRVGMESRLKQFCQDYFNPQVMSESDINMDNYIKFRAEDTRYTSSEFMALGFDEFSFIPTRVDSSVYVLIKNKNKDESITIDEVTIMYNGRLTPVGEYIIHGKQNGARVMKKTIKRISEAKVVDSTSIVDIEELFRGAKKLINSDNISGIGGYLTRMITHATNSGSAVHRNMIITLFEDIFDNHGITAAEVIESWDESFKDKLYSILN